MFYRDFRLLYNSALSWTSFLTKISQNDRNGHGLSRSNAINIAERLGLPKLVIDNARQLYGTASAEINEVILDMEQFKQDFEEHIHEAQHYLTLSRELYEKLLVAKQKIAEHQITQRYKKMKELSEVAAMARSLLHKRLRQFRALAAASSQNAKKLSSLHVTAESKQEQQAAQDVQDSSANNNKCSVEYHKQSPPSEKRIQLPKIGDVVYVSSLATEATVLKVELSKDEIIVQVRLMKLRLKLSEIQT